MAYFSEQSEALLTLLDQRYPPTGNVDLWVEPWTLDWDDPDTTFHVFIKSRGFRGNFKSRTLLKVGAVEVFLRIVAAIGSVAPKTEGDKKRLPELDILDVYGR